MKILNARMPISAIGTICVGSVAAGLWFQSTTDFSRYMSKTCSSSSALDVGGLRFGMPKIVVTPPAAAACVLVVMSSLCVKPGSRVCTCGSTIPGITSLPAASIVRPTSEISTLGLTSPTIFSPSTSTSAGRRPAGVTTSPPAIRRSIAI